MLILDLSLSFIGIDLLLLRDAVEVFFGREPELVVRRKFSVGRIVSHHVLESIVTRSLLFRLMGG